jgi:2-methylcitrate dehydratase
MAAPAPATPTPAGGVGDALAGMAAQFAADTDVDAVALRLLDTLACALGAERLAGTATHEGATTREGAAAGTKPIGTHTGEFGAIDGIVRLAGMLDRAGTLAGGGEATVWATGERTSVESAAMRNGVAARYLDLNDTYVARAIVHPSDLIAMLVAQAEAAGAQWTRLAESVTVAYEVHCRLAEQADLRRRGLEASTLTPLAAAAGCAWLAGLSEEDTANALSLSCLDAATLRAVRLGRLSDWKAVASARGAVKGWFAVQATRAGLRAPAEALDSPDGFTGRITGPLIVDPQDRHARLGQVIIKQYPLQVFIQRPAALAARIHREVGVADVDEVVVRTFAEAVQLVGGPVRADLNPESADHSLRFGVAAMLSAGRLGPGDVHHLVDDRRVRALAERVAVEESAIHTAAFPTRLGADVEVRLQDGTKIAASSDGVNELDSAALRTKFRTLAGTDEWVWPWRLAGDPLPTDIDSVGKAKKGGTGIEHA